MPSSRHVRITRTAISPRFAIRIFESNATPGWASRNAVSYGRWAIARLPGPPLPEAPSAGRCGGSPPSTRRTGGSSTRHAAGAAAGLVAVADHQRVGPRAARACVGGTTGVVAPRLGAPAPGGRPGSIAHRHDGGGARARGCARRGVRDRRAPEMAERPRRGRSQARRTARRSGARGRQRARARRRRGLQPRAVDVPRRAGRDRDIVHHRSRPRTRARRAARRLPRPGRRSARRCLRDGRRRLPSSPLDPREARSASSSIEGSSSAAPGTSTTAVASSSHRRSGAVGRGRGRRRRAPSPGLTRRSASSGRRRVARRDRLGVGIAGDEGDEGVGEPPGHRARGAAAAPGRRCGRSAGPRACST